MIEVQIATLKQNTNFEPQTNFIYKLGLTLTLDLEIDDQYNTMIIDA